MVVAMNKSTLERCAFGKAIPEYVVFITMHALKSAQDSFTPLFVVFSPEAVPTPNAPNY